MRKLFSVIALSFVIVSLAATVFVGVDKVGIWCRLVAGGTVLGIFVSLVLALNDMRRRRPIDHSKGLLAIGLGAALNLAIYFGLALIYAGPLEKAYYKLTHNQGCTLWHIENATYNLCADDIHPDTIILRDPAMTAMPSKVIRAFLVSEDARDQKMLFAIDPIALARALRHPGREGASGITSQLVRPLLGLFHEPPHTLHAFVTKLKVVLATAVLDGMITRQQGLAAYGSIVDMAQTGNVKVEGVSAAARVFFHKEPAQLDDAEAFELAALLHEPGGYYPYPKDGEAADRFQTRRDHMAEHIRLVVANGVKKSMLTHPEADNIMNNLGNNFVDRADYDRALPPPIAPLLAQLPLVVPDYRDRYLAIDAAWSPRAQVALDAAVDSGLEHIRPRLTPEERDIVKADAAVVDFNGGILAVMGLYNAATDVGSVQKVAAWSESRQSNILTSFHQKIDRMAADVAIATSNDTVACDLVTKIGTHRYAAELSAIGFTVTNPALAYDNNSLNSICLGAGVQMSPLSLAEFLRSYSDNQPGVLIAPSFFRKIVDVPSGKVLQHLESRRIFPVYVAREMQAALRETPRIPGATLTSTLGDLAQPLGLYGKTGTPHSMRNGQLHGGGGSWAAVGSIRLKVAIAVRVQTTTTDIGIDGGPAAGPIIHALLSQMEEKQ
jgi:membrane peptidoglycan carboxypeptidase